MSFHKCWNLLALLTYNDILVYGQYKYLLSVYQYWLDLYLWQGRNLHLNYNIICPSSLPFHIYCSHSSAQSIHSGFLYTTQGDAEHAELQDSVYTYDTQGCYIAGMRLHRKNSFHLPTHWPKFYPVQIIWIPMMKLNWLVWSMEHSCHYLFEWKAQDSPLHYPALDAIMGWVTHSICTQEHF